MPRRYRPEKREVTPDLRYNNIIVTMFINRLMTAGKKSVAQGVVYDSFDLVEQRTKRNPLEVFEQAMHNATPQIEVKPRRVGGATYQVPMEVPATRRTSLAIRWILMAARKRSGRSMAERLAAELMDAANGQGAAVKRKDDTHRMAEANRAFAHYRF
ncbi:MAG: 30S ribosomal protein S7 [Chloroflexi bacterium]|nr:30S ribosomal protein S7 [Chloroflexota bacterium]MCI0578625.1 30S ribosomal protein S7 [Chloroflexota bacterium]MCI0647198.1 30S ribosomal protein S7 [Chloroflexota bacterium]MCI0728924.1 30S ribosomal protein S7 [Chloroflexota bacterium]